MLIGPISSPEHDDWTNASHVTFDDDEGAWRDVTSQATPHPPVVRMTPATENDSVPVVPLGDTVVVRLTFRNDLHIPLTVDRMEPVCTSPVHATVIYKYTGIYSNI